MTRTLVNAFSRDPVFRFYELRRCGQQGISALYSPARTPVFAASRMPDIAYARIPEFGQPAAWSSRLRENARREYGNEGICHCTGER